MQFPRTYAFLSSLRSGNARRKCCTRIGVCWQDERRGTMRKLAQKAACKHPSLKALLAVAYNFGFRKSELLGLRVSQVDLSARTIQLRPGETKSGQGRTVVMTDDVYPLLAECLKGRKPSDSVFTWKDGRRVKDFRGT